MFEFDLKKRLYSEPVVPERKTRILEHHEYTIESIMFLKRLYIDSDFHRHYSQLWSKFLSSNLCLMT